MEKNIAKHVLADVLWITHKAKGERETRALYELLIRSYQTRQMQWHEECLQQAWDQYRHWLSSGSGLKLPGDQQHSQLRPRKKSREMPYPIRLEKRGRGEWEFAWPSTVLSLMDKLETGGKHLDRGELNKARRILNSILKECPYFIDALNYLAVIHWNIDDLVEAEKIYLKAYEIGSSVIPPSFRGQLPWGWADNRPFLRTLHGLAVVKLRLGDRSGAREFLEMLIKLDPDDPIGVRGMLEDLRKGTVPRDE